MASVFKRFDNSAVKIARTLIYTVPAGVTALVWSGQFVNQDVTNKSDHNCTLEVQKVDTSYVLMGKKDVPVAYGGPCAIEKFSLSAGEKVYASGDVDNMLTVSISVVEMS